MKQNITAEQLNKLSEKGKEKLIQWWKPVFGDKFMNWAGEVFYGEQHGSDDESYTPDKIYYAGSEAEGKEKDLPLLSIGQMIEFLGLEVVCLENEGNYYSVKTLKHLNYHTEPEEYPELCDALWEACKEVLEKK